MIIIIHGNPIHGFSYYGPFEDEDAACNWVEYSAVGHREITGDWWISPLNVVGPPLANIDINALFPQEDLPTE